MVNDIPVSSPHENQQEHVLNPAENDEPLENINDIWMKLTNEGEITM